MREETRCRHMGYRFRLAARVLLYASSHRQDNTYHGLCYTSRGALAAMRNSSMGPSMVRSYDPSHHERTLLPRSYISLPSVPRLVQQRPWYLLSCVWNGAYKGTLAANGKIVAHVAAAGFLSRYLSRPLPYV